MIHCCQPCARRLAKRRVTFGPAFFCLPEGTRAGLRRQRFLGIEMAVETAVRQPGGRHHLGDADALQPALAEQPRCGIADGVMVGFALLAADPWHQFAPGRSPRRRRGFIGAQVGTGDHQQRRVRRRGQYPDHGAPAARQANAHLRFPRPRSTSRNMDAVSVESLVPSTPASRSCAAGRTGKPACAATRFTLRLHLLHQRRGTGGKHVAHCATHQAGQPGEGGDKGPFFPTLPGECRRHG